MFEKILEGIQSSPALGGRPPSLASSQGHLWGASLEAPWCWKALFVIHSAHRSLALLLWACKTSLIPPQSNASSDI